LLASAPHTKVKPYRVGLELQLRQFLPQEKPLHAITEEVAAHLYQAETERPVRPGRLTAVAPYRNKLKTTKRFFRWLVEDRRYLVRMAARSNLLVVSTDSR
jgi:hypothetical protein